MLHGKLREYVTDRRAKGDSWRRISLDIRDEIGLDVTHETLRSWYPDDAQAVTAGDAA